VTASGNLVESPQQANLPAGFDLALHGEALERLGADRIHGNIYRAVEAERSVGRPSGGAPA